MQVQALRLCRQELEERGLRTWKSGIRCSSPKLPMWVRRKVMQVFYAPYTLTDEVSISQKMWQVKPVNALKYADHETAKVLHH